MASTFRTMTVEHLGPDATETDLAEFRALCEAAQRLHPELDDAAATDAVFGDGDYFRNAARLGVDVDAVTYPHGRRSRTPSQILESYATDADAYLGRGWVVVDHADGAESFSGDEIVLLETAAGVAFEFINGSFRRPADGSTYTLRTEDDYRVAGGRWHRN